MPPPNHVFISFKTEERDFAFLLKIALEKYGLKVWWQESLQCAQEWHGEIDNAIKDAGAIIVIWSKVSMESEWVTHEASQAIAKSIYAPIRKDAMEIRNPFNRLQAIDMINWNGNPNDPGCQVLK